MSKESDKLLQQKIEELKLTIRRLNDPKAVALRCGMDYKETRCTPILLFHLLNIQAEIKYPELIVRDGRNGKNLNIAYQALVCYYLTTSAVSSFTHHPESNWVSFADLPDGRFYNQAFQGYTGDKLATYIRSDRSKFSNSATQLNGSILDLGDAAFQFFPLPKVPVAVVYWEGDEEFPSNCKILFDATVSNYLPTDACAILGSMLSQEILIHFNKS